MNNLLLWGGAGVAAVLILPKILKPAATAPPAAPGKPAPFVVPPDISDQILRAWLAAGSPPGQDGWIKAAATVLPLTGGQLGQLYGQIVGYHQNLVNRGQPNNSSSWPTPAMVYAWVNAIVNQ